MSLYKSDHIIDREQVKPQFRLKQIQKLQSMLTTWFGAALIIVFFHQAAIAQTESDIQQELPSASKTASGIYVIDEDYIELSGAQNLSDLLESKAFYWTNYLTKFFINGEFAVGNVTSANQITSIPISAVERIEFIPSGHAGSQFDTYVGSVVNIVLKDHFEGMQVQVSTHHHSLKGGDEKTINFTTGTKGETFQSMFNIQQYSIEEIRNKDREYSKVKVSPDSSFWTSQGLSYRGNNIIREDESAVLGYVITPIGDCDPAIYTSVSAAPVGDVCAFPHADHSWQTDEVEQTSFTGSLSSEVDDDNMIYTTFRYSLTDSYGESAPTPSHGGIIVQMDDIFDDPQNRPAGFENETQVYIAHRFVGNGNRTFTTNISDVAMAFGIQSELKNNLVLDLSMAFDNSELSDDGENLICKSCFKTQIENGNYDLVNPLSQDPAHLEAVERISHDTTWDREWQDVRLRATVSNDQSQSLDAKDLTWTVGSEYSSADYKDEMDQRRVDEDVLGSFIAYAEGGLERYSIFGDLNIPLNENMQVQLGARHDSYDEVDSINSHRIGINHQVGNNLNLRGYYSSSGNAPDFYELYGTVQHHPFVTNTSRCNPNEGATSQQTTANLIGNPNVDPEDLTSFGIGFTSSSDNLTLSTDLFVMEIDNGILFDPQTIIDLYHCGLAPEGTRVEIIQEDESESGGGFVSLVDVPALNLSSESYTGALLTAQYNWEIATTQLSILGELAHIIDYEAIAAGVPLQDVFPENQLGISLRATQNNITGQISARMIPSYGHGVIATPIENWSALDAAVKWQDFLGWEDFELTAGINNLTGSELPDGVMATGLGAIYYPSSTGKTLYVSGELKF